MNVGSFPGGKKRPGRDADPSPPILPMALSTVDSASNRNEYKENFLGLNAAGA